MKGQLSEGIQLALLNPGLVVSIMGGELDSGVVVDVVVGMPIT